MKSKRAKGASWANANTSKEDESSPYIKASKDSFLTITFLSGSGAVNGIPFKALDSFFIPAGSDARITGHGYQYVLTGIPR